MTNPLIAKYEEIYGKKEEPKPEYVKLSQEQTDTLNKYLENPNLPYVPYQSVATSNPHPSTFKKLISYDPHSGEDSFLQVAEKIKNKDARVTSVTFNRDSVGVFTTGLTTITFEVQVWDT
jgi:hypothetical protein